MRSSRSDLNTSKVERTLSGPSERTVHDYKKRFPERGNLFNDYGYCRSLPRVTKSDELDFLLATIENLFNGARGIRNLLSLGLPIQYINSVFGEMDLNHPANKIKLACIIEWSDLVGLLNTNKTPTGIGEFSLMGVFFQRKRWHQVGETFAECKVLSGTD